MPNVSNNTIEHKLRQAWRQQRRYVHLRGAAHLLIWLVCLVSIDFLIDWGVFFRFRMWSGLGLLLVITNIVILGWVLWYEWLRHLKTFRPLFVSLDVEDKHPELSSLLVSYTQLDGTAKNQPDVSVELIDAMREQAVSQTRRLDFREIVKFGELKKMLLVAGGVLLVFGALSLAGYEHMGVLAQRLAGLDASYPTRTKIIRVTGDFTVRAGDSANVAAQVDEGMVVPDKGWIYIKPADNSSGWKAEPLTPDGTENGFERTLKEIVKDSYYYVQMDDDQSPEYRITVVPAPQIVAKQVKLIYPKYMEKADFEEDRLNLEVPEGTKVRWRLTSDTSVARMVVNTYVTSQDKVNQITGFVNLISAPTSLVPVAGPVGTAANLALATRSSGLHAFVEANVDGKIITFDLAPRHGFKYTFLWTEGASGREFQFGDVEYSVRVIPDRLPDVTMEWPRQSGLATANKKFHFLARAGDDYGLDKAWLVYTIYTHKGSTEKRLLLHDFQGRTGEKISYPWQRINKEVRTKLKEDLKDLQPGAKIEVAIEVADRNPGQQAKPRSATRQFTIVTPDAYIEWYRRELAAQRDEIKRIRDWERTSSKKVNELKKQEKGR